MILSSPLFFSILITLKTRKGDKEVGSFCSVLFFFFFFFFASHFGFPCFRSAASSHDKRQTTNHDPPSNAYHSKGKMTHHQRALCREIDLLFIISELTESCGDF